MPDVKAAAEFTRINHHAFAGAFENGVRLVLCFVSGPKRTFACAGLSLITPRHSSPENYRPRVADASKLFECSLHDLADRCCRRVHIFAVRFSASRARIRSTWFCRRVSRAFARASGVFCPRCGVISNPVGRASTSIPTARSRSSPRRRVILTSPHSLDPSSHIKSEQFKHASSASVGIYETSTLPNIASSSTSTRRSSSSVTSSGTSI